ncbi:MAG: WbqC family protein [Flavobacteriaceae bacterium]|nr:WbqC family protein [Flavobacteriaceae bacterium]
MNTLVHPTYFPSISHCVAIVKANKLVFEVNDTYQKQTYRNRTNIYAANGKLSLTVPVVFSQKNRQLYRDIKIHNEEKWQALHWKSLLSAYSTSPFFEFYEHDLAPLFHTKQENMMDFNFKCLETIFECLQWDLDFSKTSVFEKEPTNINDFRYLANVRKEKTYKFSEYKQVFSDKHGFIGNLSILDLLFNEGPNAVTYLKAQTLS